MCLLTPVFNDHFTDSFLSQHHYYLVWDQVRLLGAFSAESPVNEDHCFSTVSIRDPPLRSGSVAHTRRHSCGVLNTQCSLAEHQSLETIFELAKLLL